MDRRGFLSLLPASLIVSGFPNYANASSFKDGRLCVIILEGGMDGIAAVPPVGDKSLPRLRKHLEIKDGLAINPFFGLHPSLSNFAEMLYKNEASIVHATSFPYTKRSHFEGQNVVEAGVIKPFSSQTGWLGRAMDELDLGGRALSLDTPLLIRGQKKVENYFPANLHGSIAPTESLVESLKSVYEGDYLETSDLLIKQIESTRHSFLGRSPVDLAVYAGEQMRSGDGPKLAVIRVNDFDTHARQGADEGAHARQLKVVDDVLGALKAGLDDTWSKTLVMTITEFGRTAAINGSDGTDHGYGTATLLAGGIFNQSAVIADWPGLKKRQMFEERDLMATIDMRSVCSACLEATFGLPHEQSASEVFFDAGLPRIYNELFA